MTTEHNYDFAALADAVRESNGTRETLDALWGAVWDLEHWCFIARGEMPTNVTPYCAVVDEKPMVYIFTDSDQCDACSRELGFVDENDCTPIIMMAPDGFLGWLDLLQRNNVWGVYFNHGPHNFYSPLTNMIPMRDYFEERKKHVA